MIGTVQIFPFQFPVVIPLSPGSKLIPHEENGSLRFVYADADYCKCVYVGTEAAYQRYQKYAMRQDRANAQLEAAQMNEDASMNWGMWGPWGPWY